MSNSYKSVQLKKYDTAIDDGVDSQVTKLNLPKPSLALFFLLAVIFIIFSTIFEPAYMPAVPLVAGARMFIQDLFLWVLVLFAIMSSMSHNKLAIQSPVGKYVIIFFVIVVIEAMYAIVVTGNPIFSVYNDVKPFFYYLLFFPVIWCFGSEKGIDWIIKLWAVLALFGAMLYIFQFVFGQLSIFENYSWLYSGSLNIGTGGAQSVSVDFKRLISQGTVLFRIMLFVAFSLWLYTDGKTKKWWGVLALILAAQVALQFTRGMYITTILALIAMPFIVKDKKISKKIINILMLSIVVITFMVIYKVMFSSGKGGYSLIEFIGQRFFNAVTQSGSDSSLDGRRQGAQMMFDLIETHGNWFLGLGFGNGVNYGDSTYVSLLLKTGWVGTIAFLVLFGVSSLRAFKNLKYVTDPIQKAILLALFVSTGRHLVNGITQADFTYNVRIPALIISVAIMEVIIVRALNQRQRINHVQ